MIILKLGFNADLINAPKLNPLLFMLKNTGTEVALHNSRTMLINISTQQ